MLVEGSHVFLKLGRKDHSRQLNYTILEVGIQAFKKRRFDNRDVKLCS